MKIRHKQSGVELEGKFTTITRWESSHSWAQPTPIEVSYYAAADRPDRSNYDCREWEEVKTATTWVDVTKDCRAVEPGGIYTQRIWIDDKAFVAQIVNCDFRFRKIRCCYDDVNHTAIDAFIVEKRQS